MPTILVLRRIAALVLATGVLGCAFYAAYKRAREDKTVVFVYSPLSIVPAEHLDQVEIVRETVPRGATIVYLMNTFEGWQSEMWQRSLYPDYDLEEITGMNEFTSLKTRQMMGRKRVEYILSAGVPPLDPGFVWHVSLPSYPNAVPIVLGRLSAK